MRALKAPKLDNLIVIAIISVALLQKMWMQSREKQSPSRLPALKNRFLRPNPRHLIQPLRGVAIRLLSIGARN
jgi:hypothetical protein